MSSLACIQWIRNELEMHGDLQELNPPLVDTTSLCEFVTDGRALCLLTNVVLEHPEEELPKKLQRSLRQLSKFHALERVQFFIKWCRTRAMLEEHQVFTTVQLLDEVNEVAVSETIVALRNKTRPRLGTLNAVSMSSDRIRSSSSSPSHANRLSSFLNKFPSAPIVATKPAKPPRTPRISLTSSGTSTHSSPRDLDEQPVLIDDTNASKSRLRMPFRAKSPSSPSPLASSPQSSHVSNPSPCSHDDTPSRSWSSKLAALSRSVSSSSSLASCATPLTVEDNNHTPLSSPPASPLNRVSIPSAFLPSRPRESLSRSKLSAFLNTVDTPSVVLGTEDTPPITSLIQDVETVKDVEEEEASVQADTKTDSEPIVMARARPSSMKLLAFLQKVEPVAMPASRDDEDFERVSAELVTMDEDMATNKAVVCQDKDYSQEVAIPAPLLTATSDMKQDVVEAIDKALLEAEGNEEVVNVVTEMETHESLRQMLHVAEALIQSKDSELVAMSQELELFKAQGVQENPEKLETSRAKQEDWENKGHMDLERAQMDASMATKEKHAMQLQVHDLARQNESLKAEVTSLREDIQTLEQSVQLARDSEEAARFAAQVAFAARDAADEVNQQLRDQLCGGVYP
ncbi:hypothetical protein CCR75_001560 [Bremia lactucae]|uniref:Calponin-homology (CH) domain-containing protein n=1 Tax=Bremia lactucae TaxID=4779 RepID=A0A976IG24_BRELC|nr:hypothetical protein CCR75_001560 [Bremia lactucae]